MTRKILISAPYFLPVVHEATIHNLLTGLKLAN
jgi:hypothetical protein